MKKLNVKKYDKGFKFDKFKKKFNSKIKRVKNMDFSLDNLKGSFEKIKYVSRYRLIFLIGCLLILVGNLSAYFLTYGEFVSRFDENSDGSITGISNDTVIIDDLKTDYDYYMGLNYTAASDGRLPSGENQELYSDSNLVQAKIIYNGTDINSGFRGYVSDTEMQYVYIYYKTFAVNNNGTSSTSDDYIDIELIDNPFTYRPDGKAFNGWVTTYDDAVVSLDTDIYVRNVKVPVTYTSGVPDAINITLNASWIDASWTTVSSSRNWATAFADLDAAGMKEVAMVEHVVEYAPLYMDGYFYQVTIARYESYAGYYNANGVLQNSGTCNRRAGCTYYELIGHELYDESATYYELNGSMQLVDHADIEFEIISEEFIPNEDIGDGIVAGYYRSVSLTRGASLVGYYDNLGVLQNSGTCGSTACTYYELIQYYEDDGSVSVVNENDTYYYLVTRDTNIIVMTSDMSTTWASAQSKPFTLTSFYGDDYRSSVVWSVATYADSWWGGGSYDGVVVNAYADMTIENIAISCGSEFDSTSNAASGTNSEGAFYGRFFNVKLGRGIVRGDGNSTFVSVLGGSNGASGSSGNVTEYRLMIESGFYNSISIGNGVSNSSTVYMEADAIYGNDYDRALLNNSRLDIYYCASGSWGGNYYSSSNIGISFDLTVKSGSFGSSKYDHTTGIYVGARYGGTHYTARSGKILGGYIYNLIGGPITANNRGDLNDTYMYIMGGTIDMVTGGAGTSATYGNRIVQVTGGTVNYSVFGGSNGYNGGNGDGTLNGSSFVYIGGDAEIGSDTNVNNGNTLFGAEAGSVFGIGNGNDNYASIGSNKNSNIIIDKDATIKGNVYGGGNYAAVGVSSNASTTSTYIKILGGEIRGSVYGGGNRNGSGSTNITASVKIEMYGGEVKNAIYGGSNESGTIYGTVDLLMVGGTANNVFGGGRGGYVSNNQQGTFVARAVNVTIGSSTSSLVPVVTGEVFGGSAFGTVNGTTNNTTVSSYNTVVVVNKGTIGSVFGGGKGDNSFTPYVLGNVTVTVNGGDITNVFGGNDAAGTPNGTVTVYLKGGNVTNTYGGGNMTSVHTTNVYLQGATCGKIFGGSNQTGDVTTSNVTATSGTSTALYGGNNQGGVTTTSNVLINGATIGTVYGGGSVATTGTTNVTMNSGKVDNIYGGGESADINVNTNVTVNAGTIQSVYGGSNQAGNVPESNIEINSGKITNVFGGNNAGGITSETYIELLGGTCKNVYGGGNNAQCETSNIVLDGSNVSNLFGGGNSAGLTTSNINLKSGAATRVFGGSNQTGNVTTSNIITSESEKTESAQNPDIDVDVTSTGRVNTDDSGYTSIIDFDVKITNNSDDAINNWTVNLSDEDSVLHTNNSVHEISASDGVYTFNQTTTQNVSNDSEEKKVITIAPGESYTVSFSIYSNKIVEGYKPDNVSVIGVAADGNSIVQNDSNLLVSNLYGGNNKGGQTETTNINLNSGYTHNIYGGGNLAPVNTTNVNLQNIVVGGQLYGGGNQAAVYNDTNLTLSGVSVTGNVFGGGNAGIVGNDTNVYINSSTILESVYAGGNGASAVVNKDAKLTIDGVTVVKKHVFGGGNAAATGTELSNNSVSLVNIAGANIGGNVYGGANTSVVYGNTKLFIGYDSIENNTNLVKGDIYIGGTVFGGGEANASGSANYDFSFISVTVGIDIKINGNGHDNFDIDGSIFGSGNASSTTGYSYIDIDNYGTLSDIKRNISIQRANKVTISNSYIALKGAADRTNEFDDEPFTISRVDELKLKNNSSLYLEKGANLLKHYISAVDIGNNEVLGTVVIDDETKDVVKNVDNRIYIVGSTTTVLNIATNENITAFGEVDGMTFFGLYEYTREGDIETAMYKPAYGYGDSAPSNDLYYFSDGSYVLGMHETNHDITVDGFYSNFENEEVEGEIQVKYIEPTPEDSNYYMWTIGEMTQSYVIDNLQASKYLTLGTEELPLIYHSDPNTVFSVVGFNYNLLNPEVNLLEEHEVPRIAASSTDADNNMSLVMETTDVGWTTSGSTVFMSNSDTPYKGTVDYRSENSTVNPTFQFYLYHSKNLATNGSMGQVTISLLAVTPIDALTNEVERINIVINLSRKLFNANDYEASITTGKQYDLFASRDVNITTTGSFSAYYSLFVGTDADTFYKDGYYRALVTDYVLPAKTKITMIDYLDHDDPEYYYYNVSESDYQNALQEFSTNSEVSYEFSRFIKMGSNSSGNNYDDAEANSSYYDSDLNIINEEFIFIIDFSESNITTNVLDKGFLIELRDSAHQTRVSVLGAAQSLMKYNLHYNQGAVVDVKGTLSKTNIYPGDVVDLTVETDFIQKTSGGKTIYDTSYFDKQLGIKISILDANRNVVNGASLLGITYTLDEVDYYPRTDGTVRLNIADRISNVASRIKLNTTDSLAPGDYTMKIESFGSPDGIYYGLESSDSVEIDFVVLDTVYGLSVSLNEKLVIIDSEKGHTLNKNNALVFNYKYNSSLSNPNIRISLYRRDYSSVYSTEYNLVDLHDYVTNNYNPTDKEFEYMLSTNPSNNTSVYMYLKDNLVTGTYRFTFALYDGDSYIGEVYQNVIIK